MTFFFLDHNFKSIARVLRYTESPIQSRKQAIKSLVHKAAGLFIWAATACWFISKSNKFLLDQNSVLFLKMVPLVPNIQKMSLVRFTLKFSQIFFILRLMIKTKWVFIRLQRRILGALLFYVSTLPILWPAYSVFRKKMWERDCWICALNTCRAYLAFSFALHPLLKFFPGSVDFATRSCPPPSTA